MLNLMKKMNAVPCSCGKTHFFDSEIFAGKGAIKNLSLVLEKYNSKNIYVFADKNTYAVGGSAVLEILEETRKDATNFSPSKTPYFIFVLPKSIASNIIILLSFCLKP